jgi:hypothetical protein
MWGEKIKNNYKLIIFLLIGIIIGYIICMYMKEYLEGTPLPTLPQLMIVGTIDNIKQKALSNIKNDISNNDIDNVLANNTDIQNYIQVISNKNTDISGVLYAYNNKYIPSRDFLLTSKKNNNTSSMATPMQTVGMSTPMSVQNKQIIINKQEFDSIKNNNQNFYANIKNIINQNNLLINYSEQISNINNKIKNLQNNNNTILKKSLQNFYNNSIIPLNRY